MTARPSAFQSLPPELLLTICKLVDIQDLFRLRATCKTLASATTSLSLWRHLSTELGKHVPLPPLPRTLPSGSTTDPTEADRETRAALEWSLLTGMRIEERWNTVGAQPRTCFRTRAHIDRITCLKLVVGPVVVVGASEESVPTRFARKRWLITGSVDGFIRVWDLTGPLPDVREQGTGGASEVDRTRSETPGRPFETAAATATSEDTRGGSTSSESESNRADAPTALRAKLPALPSPRARRPDPRRRKATNLICEADTGGDVTALDSVLSPCGGRLHIAVGSYYSAAGCVVFVLDLAAQPPFLDRRGALDPPQWCGTQCVSILKDKVAVGTYTGLLHLFDWNTGWRGGIERADRSSTAAVKLFDHHLLAISRLGVVELFALPEENEERAKDATVQGLPSTATTTAAAWGQAEDYETYSSLLSIEDPSTASDVGLPQQPANPSSSSDGPSAVPASTARRQSLLLARYSILEGNKPLLSVSFGEVRPASPPPDGSPAPVPSNSDPHAPLALFAVDLGGLTHLEFQPTSSHRAADPRAHPAPGAPALAPPFPYRFPPAIRRRESLTGERLIGAAAGRSGRRGVLLTSLGGVPPSCCVRAYSLPRKPDAVPRAAPSLLALRATPTVSLPHEFAERQARLRGAAQQTGRTGAMGAYGSADVLTEVAVDEEGAVVCLATARGVVWVADYGQDPGRGDEG